MCIYIYIYIYGPSLCSAAAGARRLLAGGTSACATLRPGALVWVSVGTSLMGT